MKKFVRSLAVPAVVLAGAAILWWNWPQPNRSSSASGPVPATSVQVAQTDRLPTPLAGEDPRPLPETSAAQITTNAVIQFDQWASAFAQAPDELARQELLAKGVDLAKARRERLLELMRSDPAAAWDAAMPYHLRRQMPAEIEKLLEERIDGQGDFLVRGVVPFKDSKSSGPSILRHVQMSGRFFQAHTFGRRLYQKTAMSVPLHGFAIGQEMVVHPDAALVLEQEEAQVRMAAAAEVGTTCIECGREPIVPGKPLFASTGNQMFAFCCKAHAQALNERFAAAEAAAQVAAVFGTENFPTNPPPDTEVTFTQGRRTMLYMRVAFQDDPSEPISYSRAVQEMNLLNDYYVENSYHTMSLVSTVTPLLLLPQTKRYYGANDPGLLLSDARQAAYDAGYPFTEWDLDIVAHTQVREFGWAGLGYLGRRGIWLQAYDIRVTSHELGHNLGLHHANYWETAIFPPPPRPTPFAVDSDSEIGHDGINAPGALLEYGDLYDTMGSAGSRQFNTVNKYLLKWLREPYNRRVVGSETNRLFSFDTTDLVEGRIYGLRVRKDFERDYWLDFRENINQLWLTNGVELHWPAGWPGNPDTRGSSMLLDTTPGSGDSFTFDSVIDAPIVVGRTYTDEEVPVHITPVAKGGIPGEQWLDVVVMRGSFPSNQAPSLILTASAQQINPGGRVDFTALSGDPDGDRLSYYWEFSDRTFDNGPAVSKTFNNTGWFVARCEVSDMKGGVTSDHTVIRVGNPTNFTMSGQVIDTLGQPLRNVRMHNGRFGNEYRWTYTDSEGAWTLTDQLSGAYTNRGFLYGYRTEPLDFSNPLSISGGNAFNLNHLATPMIRVSIEAENDGIEGDSPQPGRFRISRTGDTTDPLQVFYTTSGQAVPTNNYEGLSNSLMIPAGQESAELLVNPVQNAMGEGLLDMTVTLRRATNFFRVVNVVTNTGSNIIILKITNNLTFPGWELVTFNQQQVWFQTYPVYVMGTAEATIHLQDDEPPALPRVSLAVIDDAAVETGDDQAVIMVSRTVNRAGDLTVRYGTSGVAENGLDYFELPGTVTIPDGQDFAFIRIIAREDQFVEGNEPFTITIRTNAAYTVAGGAANLVLVDNDLPLVTVTASDAVASELGPNTGRFTITRAGDLLASLEVRYLLNTGTATLGVDYDDLPGVVTIPVDQTSVDVLVTPRSDSQVEGLETVRLVLSDSPIYNVGNPGTAVVTIQEEAFPTVSLIGTDLAAQEGGSDIGTVELTRTGPTNTLLIVTIKTGGLAVPQSDYAAVGPNIIIPAGSNSVPIQIVPFDDAYRETNEEVIVTLVEGANYNIGAPASLEVNIMENDNGNRPEVSFLQPRSDADEAQSALQIPVGISQAVAPGQDVIVEYRIVGGSASRPADYSLMATGYLSFFTNSPIVTNITLSLIDDMLLEPPESVIITLFDPVLIVTNIDEMAMTTNIMAVPTNAFLGPYRTHTVTIHDDDRNGLVVLATNSLARESGPTPSGFRIIRTGNTQIPLTVGYAITGTASSPTDFVPISNSIVIPAGSNSVIIPLVPADDAVEEDAETVILTLTSAAQSRLIGAGQATITIQDNDGTVQFLFDTFEAKENAGPAMISVQRTGATNTSVTVEFSMSAGTAINGVDYQGTNGTLVFPPGVTMRTFFVPLVDDELVELDETVSLSLTNPTGGVLLGGQRQATLFIVNDDTAFGFGTNTFRAAENASNALIGVMRVGVTGVTASVTFTTSNLSAQAGSDYRGTNVVLNFLPGETNHLVLIPILDDIEVEGNETVQLTLSDPGPKSQVATNNNPATLVIVDDESVIEFVTANFEFEEYVGLAAIQVVRRGGVNSVTVDFATMAGTALDPSDFLNTSGTLSFLGDQVTLKPDGSGLSEFIPGETNKTILVSIADDLLGEGAETFSIRLTNPRGPATGALPGSTSLGANTNSTVTILDNETPGNVDFEYNSGDGADGPVFSVTLQPDGRAVFGGDFLNVDGVAIARVVRLRTDGSLDTSFSPGQGADATVNVVHSQPDGRILIGGDFSFIDNTARSRLARLTADGAIDPFFQGGGGANAPVRAFAVQSDNKILVGGDFSQINGLGRSRVARLNTNGVVDALFAPVLDGPVRAILVQPDGKIVLGGSFSMVGNPGEPAPGIVRVLTNGVVDGSFDVGQGPNNSVNALGWQDGKILVGGRFTAFDQDEAHAYLVRLNANGSLDATFNPSGTGPDGPVETLAVTASGKVVIGGTFTHFNDLERNRFARLRADGQLDGLFDVGEGANAAVHSVAIQANSSVILGGEFTEIDGLPRNRIARIHGDEFSTVVGVEFLSSEFRVSEGGGKANITVVRVGNTNATATVEFGTVDGTADASQDYETATGTLTFAPGVVSQNFEVTIADDVMIEQDETVLLYLTNASANVEFSGPSQATLFIEDNEQAIRFEEEQITVNEGDGTVIVGIRRTGDPVGAASVVFQTMDGTATAGSDYTRVSNVVQFAVGETLQTVVVPILDDAQGESDETIQLQLSNATGGQLGLASASVIIEDNEQGIGGVDTTFDPGAGANSFVLAIGVDDMDRVVVGGGFTMFDGTNRNYLARMNSDGSHDLDFNAGAGANGLVSTLVMLGERRIIAGGAFTTFAGQPFNRVVRLNTNGLPDATFNHSAPYDGSLSVMTFKLDGRIAVGGSFSQPNPAISQMRIDGTVDANFNPGSGANAPVHAAVGGVNSQLYIGGAFTLVGGQERLRVARLLASGAVDQNFNATVITNGTVYGLARQSDGKLLVVGDFIASNSTNRTRILRLLESGAVDSSFNPGAGANGTIFDVGLQSDGKIIVVGDFIRFDGQLRRRYARLLADGALDESFDPGTGANSTVYALVVQPDNNIVIGGDFTVVNGLKRSGVARIRGNDQSEGDVSILLVSYQAGVFRVIVGSNPGDTFLLEASSDFISWAVADSETATGNSVELIDGGAGGFNRRFYRVSKN